MRCLGHGVPIKYCPYMRCLGHKESGHMAFIFSKKTVHVGRTLELVTETNCASDSIHICLKNVSVTHK